jgi:hypothetical protein
MRTSNERGIAMISTLLVMMLVSALLIGFTAMVTSDQRFRFIDRDRTQSFYAASAGLEKLTADLGNLFFVYVAPTPAQITALTTTPPTIPAASFTKMDGSSGYQIASQNLGSTTISTGPYQGLYALITKYTMDVTARTTTGGETHLQRETETVAIPVFQFGIFSDVDLSFFAGPNFNFGGRVHTNGNLFLAEGNGATLTLADKVTAVKEIVRQRLQNGVSIDAQPHTGVVNMATAPAAFRALARTEGSVVDGLNSAVNEPAWTNLSLSTYNSYIRNGRTGAKALNLPLITMGGVNADLIRRPIVNENVNNVTLFGERDFGKVSLRVLLSDTAADITTLPTVLAATPPVLLDGNWNAAVPNNGTAYGPINATHPPIAVSAGPNASAVTNTGGAVNLTPASNLAITINAGVVPAWLRPPTLTVTGYPNNPVTCTGRTATTFTGCAPVPAANLAAGKTVTATFGTSTVTTTTTAIWATGSSTITVNGGTGTAGFGYGLLWSGNVPVTCTGSTVGTLTGCSSASNVTVAANGTLLTNYLTPAATGTIGGYIKAEMQKNDGSWQDVTMELLNYGIAGPNLAGTVCNDPTPNAILRIQRLRDNGAGANGIGGANPCAGYQTSTNAWDYWPNTLFDTREGLQRDAAVANIALGGVMHHITIDVANLSKWFTCAAPYNVGPCSGNNALNNSGYSVYFSDRRNNRDANSKETAEYGWEDFVNPASGVGAPNGILDAGEDINASGTLDTYGQFPAYAGVANSVAPLSAFPLDGTARPTTLLSPPQAQINRSVLFRHALKLVRGGLGQIVAPGFTVVAENPVYIQGDWNMAANPPPANDGHVATSVQADAVTLLSTGWNDSNSFANPYNPALRPRTTNYYRLAVIGGKGMSFPQPAGTANDFGTDGGAHNFLRYLEDGTGQTLNYIGSLVTFFYSRQAVGTFKCCVTVYAPPTRGYTFDIDFLDPAKLPPLTPVFRDLNTIGFSQEIRPGR